MTEINMLELTLLQLTRNGGVSIITFPTEYGYEYRIKFGGKDFVSRCAYESEEEMVKVLMEDLKRLKS